MSNRQVDVNGFIHIKKNPISKVGVFPYLGKNIDSALEPNKIYFVYRPAEELAKPETIESFKNVPIIDEHTMVGKGATPAERKGVDGNTGSNVTQEGDFLYADLHIYSDTLKRKIDQNGKKELSMGYRVGRYEKANGMFNGQPYDFIQRDLRGNHIAVVQEGRMGKEVAVLDQGITYDHLDIVTGDTASDSTASPAADNKGDAEHNAKDGVITMADEEKEKMMAKDKAAKDAAEKEGEEKLAKDKKAKDESEEKEKKDKKEAEDKKAMDKAAKDKMAKDKEDDEMKGKEKEATDAAISGLQSQIDDFKKNGIKILRQEMAKRDDLIADVSKQFGTFATDAMDTGTEVAAYGLKKAGITAPAGSEVAVWEAYSAGRKAGRPVSVALDSKDVRAPVGSLIEKTLAASK